MLNGVCELMAEIKFGLRLTDLAKNIYIQDTQLKLNFR